MNAGSQKQSRLIAYGTPVLRRKKTLDDSDRITPTGSPNASGVVKNCVFRPVEKTPAQMPYAENLCSSATVVRIHDGALAEEYAVSLTTLVVVEVG